MNILEYWNYQQLKKSGFTYKHYQNPDNYQKGMAFWYKGKEWVYGGNVLSDNEDLPEEIKNGIWLPDESYFLEWLSENAFQFTIKYDQIYRIEATDSITNEHYRGKGADLSQALAYLITSICKKNVREYDNNEIDRYQILDE